MKMIFSSQMAPEVELLKGLLDEAGVACEVRNETIYPNLPGAAFQPEIWILNDNDYERACEVRNAWRQPLPGMASQPPLRRSSPRGGLIFVGLVLLAACGVLAWQGVRARDWAQFGIAFALFGSLGVIALVAAGQLHPFKRNKGRKGF